MTPLPFDLIRLVIDHVDNSFTLYSLLTVSKAVFPVAARALYRDPLWPNITKGDRLIDWLLTLSPIDDKNTNVLRQARGLGPNKKSQPFLDYLQFIKGMCWENVQFSPTWDSWDFPSGYPGTNELSNDDQSSPRAVFIRTTLTWAVCSPVLENIKHLYVEESNIQRYIAAVSRLRSIQTIVVNVQQNYEKACEKTIQLVKKIHRTYGKNQLRNYRLLMNPFSHTYGHIGDYNSTNVLRLYSLLPKNSKTPLRIPRTDGKVVVLDRAFDRDFAELYNVNVLEPNELQQYYADLTRGEILQRFRSVKELTITIGLDDTEIFEWAADEARHRQHSPSTLSSRWIPPSVPIEGLFVNFSSQGPPIDLQPLSDALYGFANTLVRLYLTTPLISSLPRMGPITRTLSCLHSLIIYSGTAIIIHPSLWKKLPCLSQLIVEFSEVDLETCGDTNLVWPVMNIPSLKRLSLRGYAARMFDPKSLYNMPKLEELSVRQLYGYYPLAWATRISELWHDTWDWPLPCLTQLELEVDAWLAGVRFEFLKKCPRLERIQISGGVNDRKPQSLKVLPELTATALTEVNADTDISDCCPSLQSFKLGGQWHIEKNQLAYLYNHMLPGIKVFYLGRGVKLVDCSDVEFVQITKKHPCCRDILVPLKRTSPFREFGFVKDRADGSIYYSFENEACYCMPEP